MKDLVETSRNSRWHRKSQDNYHVEVDRNTDVDEQFLRLVVVSARDRFVSSGNLPSEYLGIPGLATSLKTFCAHSYDTSGVNSET